MKKSKFILGILVAIASTAYAKYSYVYEDSDVAGLKNVTVTLGEDSDPYVAGATATSGVSTWTPAEFTNVNNSTLIIAENAGNRGYLAGANAFNTGSVAGQVTINIRGGETWGVTGGLILYGSVDDSYKPTKSTADVVINMTGGKVNRIMGGNFFSISELKHSDGTTTKFVKADEAKPDVVDTLEEYIIDRGGPSTFATGGNVYINVSGGTLTKMYAGGGGNGSVDGIVNVTISGDAQVKENIFSGARNDAGFLGQNMPYVGGTNVQILGGNIEGNVYGGGSFETAESLVKGDANVTVSGGTIGGNVYGGGQKDIVKGNSTVVLQGGTVTGNVYGSGEDNTTEGSVTVQILGGDWSNTEIYGKTDGATVEGGTELIVGAEGIAYNGELASISGFDRVTVAKGSKLNLQSGNLFDVAEHNYTITSANMGTEGSAVTTVSPDGEVKVVNPITLNFNTEGRVISGRYKIIDASQADSANVDTTTNWDSQNVTVNGHGASFEGLVWDGNVLYLDYVSPAADAVMAGNWGVFKSSQAFTGTLWGNRANACVLNKTAAPAAVTTDEKGNTIATTAPAPKGVTLAWGTAYGQSARISGVGADYSIYGGAIGLEHHFVSGRSLGAALGYDWGTVSPFGSSDIDQETLHAAVYGRAGIWQLGANSAVAVDWSAAYGDTTSESDLVDGDWTQESLQLDARVSYLRKLNDRTTGSVFAGVQYFAADSDTVDGLEVSSMQNLRAEIGAGISYKLNQKATVYGEASVYNDVMRHNPCVDDGDVCIKGSNPGRTGGTLSVGAQYDLNDDWSVRGGYSFDVAEDSTEHNFNAGAVYKF